MLHGDVVDVSKPIGASTGSGGAYGGTLPICVSEGEADYVGDYSEYDGVLCERV